MSIRKVGTILTTVLWGFWLIPLQGKRLAPEVFGIPEIQWTAALVVAALTPSVTLLALGSIFGTGDRRFGLGLLAIASLPWFYNIAIHGIGGNILARTALSLESASDRDSEIIARLVDQAVSAESSDHRGKAAGLLYSMFGVQAIWKNEAGELTNFHPTPEQQERWQATLATNVSLERSTTMLEDQLKQSSWLFGLNLGLYCTVMSGGLVWRAYRPSKLTDG
ncbi:hypothetical protein HAHE_17740 [Haloferula helveola]|uniref:Transmembrane protein n=1 Tax=Haloferula helveola TaxID=490095 RepID=A0ABN6H2L5_9BACT|nr:hypothetical protein HAHE_17740 [Haloferula helveola]